MALFGSSPSASGDRLSCSFGMVRIAVSRSETERHQTALRGRAPACSHAGTASPRFLFPGEFWDVAPQKPLRADEPVTQNDELGPRGVMASNPAGAAGIETRVRFLGWPGCLPRRLQLVFTRWSGRNSLCLVGSKRCGCHRGRTPSDSMFGSSVTGLGANPTVGGVGRVPQRDDEGRGPTRKSRRSRSS